MSNDRNIDPVLKKESIFDQIKKSWISNSSSLGEMVRKPSYVIFFLKPYFVCPLSLELGKIGKKSLIEYCKY